MNIEGLQEAIVKRMTDKCPDQKVEPFPDSGKYTLLHPSGAFLVLWSDVDLEDPQGKPVAVQKARHKIAITIMAKNLHNNNGVLQLAALAKDALSGFAPVVDGKKYEQGYVSSIRFHDIVGGIWHYAMDAIFPTDELVRA